MAVSQIGDRRLNVRFAMTDNNLRQQIDALDFGIEKSMRYHQRRRGHYERLHKFIMFLTVICGSAAFAQVLGRSEYFGAATAFFAAGDLVWGPSHLARDHEILFRRFSDLAIAIRTTVSPTQESYVQWLKKRISIETDEPPIYWALEADCDNEVRRAKGKDMDLIQIKWWARLTMYCFRHAESVFEPTPRNAAV